MIKKLYPGLYKKKGKEVLGENFQFPLRNVSGDIINRKMMMMMVVVIIIASRLVYIPSFLKI